MSADLLLKLNDLSYGTPNGRPLVKGLSLGLGGGQILAVTGPNGTGKSTLLQVLMAARAPLSGSAKVTTTSVGYLAQLQNREFHIPMTLADVITIHCRKGLNLAEALDVGLLTRTDLELAWNTASGGERQRTLLTQILLSKPKLLILDEPTNHLDSQSRLQLLQLLERFVSDGSHSVIIVCHEKLFAEHSIRNVSMLDLSKYQG